MVAFQHFTLTFAFPHCQTPGSCISDSTGCQEQSRDSQPQAAQPQVCSHLPFQAGSATRASVITEPALSLLHYGTISHFKLLPFKFWNSHIQAGAKPLQIPLLPPLQQPFQNLHFSPLGSSYNPDHYQYHLENSGHKSLSAEYTGFASFSPLRF